MTQQLQDSGVCSKQDSVKQKKTCGQ